MQILSRYNFGPQSSVQYMLMYAKTEYLKDAIPDSLLYYPFKTEVIYKQASAPVAMLPKSEIRIPESSPVFCWHATGGAVAGRRAEAPR